MTGGAAPPRLPRVAAPAVEDALVDGAAAVEPDAPAADPVVEDALVDGAAALQACC